MDFNGYREKVMSSYFPLPSVYSCYSPPQIVALAEAMCNFVAMGSTFCLAYSQGLASSGLPYHDSVSDGFYGLDRLISSGGRYDAQEKAGMILLVLSEPLNWQAALTAEGFL